MVRDIIFSPESRRNLPGNEEFIQILYQLYLYRDADEAGLAEWVKQLNDGASLESVVDGFADSPEFKKILHDLKK